MQLCEKIHSWYDELDINFEQFVEERIMIDAEVHMQKEVQPPYYLSWYTRQLPFTRGDDLSDKEAERIFKENNKQYDIDNLFIKEAYVGKSLVMKRFRPRAKGRASPIKKPFSRITIVLSEKKEAKDGSKN